MKKKSTVILGVYDLFLAFGAIFTGFMMLKSNQEIFQKFPDQWIPVLPFRTWLVPGLTLIILFGMGNILAALFSLRTSSNSSWLISALEGGTLLIFVVLQVLVLREWYLASVEFLLISIVQLFLSGYALITRDAA